ncbi:Vacuolar protein sorting-associated protein 17 [Golovinomyces cichoracearum]|uniref:Vacuolar protein sorting-associated protein 17 n=1 Tax=Golovinomyces cichoracearum TaxID=62708 RepID=A0A420J333_9PEZI|nr:Vacuolar protein sorting-associated protein 17 [Golovinomyces cichoracearum]
MDYSESMREADNPKWEASTCSTDVGWTDASETQNSFAAEEPETSNFAREHSHRPESNAKLASITEIQSKILEGDALESTTYRPQDKEPQQQQTKEASRVEPQRYHRARWQSQQLPVSQHKLQTKITGLERTGRKDPILRFDVHTNLPKFRTTQFRDVRRTHSEFVKLAEHLISSNPEAIVPAVPTALTSAGVGTDEDEARVKSSFQRWLNHVCSNPILLKDDEIILFIESDFGYSPMLRRKQPATGVRRKVIKQFAPPPDDTPELQNARPLVKALYLGMMDAGHKIDKLVKARKGLGLAESDFGVKLDSMHVQELHQGLANAYRKMGKTIQTTGDYHSAQGTAEATTIGDSMRYFSQDAYIVKETLTNRYILLRELLQAQQLTRSKSSAAERLKVSSSVRRDKVDEAISAHEEASKNEMFLLEKSKHVTKNLLLEQRRWFKRTVADLKFSIREYAIREIEAERRTLATLEIIRPDIRAIDSSGGLSRLGREADPAARRTSLGSSQGAKGDSWSGVPRRTDQLNRSITSNLIFNFPGDEEGDPLIRKKMTTLPVVKESANDSDRIDARNAASRLASATFL